MWLVSKSAAPNQTRRQRRSGWSGSTLFAYVRRSLFASRWSFKVFVSSVFYIDLHQYYFYVLVSYCSAGCRLCMLWFLHVLFSSIYIKDHLTRGSVHVDDIHMYTQYIWKRTLFSPQLYIFRKLSDQFGLIFRILTRLYFQPKIDFSTLSFLSTIDSYNHQNNVLHVHNLHTDFFIQILLSS